MPESVNNVVVALSPVQSSWVAEAMRALRRADDGYITAARAMRELKRSGMSQRQIANEVGCSRQRVTRLLQALEQSEADATLSFGEAYIAANNPDGLARTRANDDAPDDAIPLPQRGESAHDFIQRLREEPRAFDALHAEVVAARHDILQEQRMGRIEENARRPEVIADAQRILDGNTDAAPDSRGLRNFNAALDRLEALDIGYPEEWEPAVVTETIEKLDEWTAAFARTRDILRRWLNAQ